MNIGGVGSAVSPANVRDQVSTAVFKKAVDMEKQQASQLLQSVPQMPQAQPVPGAKVGGNVNTYA